MSNFQAEFQHAFALHRRGQLDAAEKIYKSILLSHPKYFDAILALGIVYLQRENFRLAERQFSLAIKINPGSGPLHNNHGNALLGLDRPLDALAAYDKAIALDPQNWEAYYNRGNVLASLKRFEEALVGYDKSISLFPNSPQVHDNRGNALANLQRFDEALASFNRAIQLDPGHARAYANRAPVLAHFKQYDKALEDYDKAATLDPNLDYLFSNRFMMRLFSCCWDDDYEKSCAVILNGVRDNILKVEPFSLLPIPSTAEDQFKCAVRFILDKESPGPKMPRLNRYVHDRIRIGYVSSDFHNHPTSHLIAGMLEAHDRSRFMVHGFSTGPASDDEYRRRVSQSFEVFIDAHKMSSAALIERIKTSEIDVLLDLNGLAMGRRTDIFAARPAPVQVNYLGYPGTMGAEYIDYIIADRHVIPEADKSAYTEKVVYLPHSYQVNDSKRSISESVPARSEHGLPESGFVFCCFNNTAKLTPDIFDVWMRVLAAVDRSVLWLLCKDASVAENLRAEARRRNISADRLVFADRIGADVHRARHKLADLFLDTLYYNAHTTASDALWAGLPVITYPGTTFSSRVAASLLHAIGLPELIANSIEEYEKLAVKLATNPDQLQTIKFKLAQNRNSYPLFDTERYTRNIETAYTYMWQLHQKGKSPKSFAVDSSELGRDII